MSMRHCRLCGQETDRLTSIREHLIESIQRYFQIQISEYDPLPQKICLACEDEVLRTVRYIVQCQKAQIDFHKQIFLERNQILEKDIKLEDAPLDLESQQEVDISEECQNREIVFKRNDRRLPPAGEGKANTSIAVYADRDQMLELRAKYDLKQLGKKLYDKHLDRILEKVHLRLTYPEIQNDLISLRNSSETIEQEWGSSVDIKVEEPSFQLKVPTVLLTSFQNPVESRSNSSTSSNASCESGSKTVTCAKCPFKTDRKFRLNQHYSEVHEKRFSCEQCSRLFGKKSKLLLHVKTYHTDLSPMVCSICAKSFRQKYNYKEHLKTHSNEGHLWFCDHCGMNFSHQHKLDVHLAKVHKSKSVKCTQCSYVAAHKYQMKQHVREVHEKSIICDHCGKRESKKCRMVAHIQKKHMPKTEFVCGVCNARYSSKAWFVKHKKEGCP